MRAFSWDLDNSGGHRIEIDVVQVASSDSSSKIAMLLNRSSKKRRAFRGVNIALRVLLGAFCPSRGLIGAFDEFSHPNGRGSKPKVRFAFSFEASRISLHNRRRPPRSAARAASTVTRGGGGVGTRCR